MMKLCGILCILSGSTGLGLIFARELTLHIAELKQLWQCMLLLQGELRYMHQPLPEAFLHLSAKTSSPFQEFFLHTAQELRQRSGRTAEEIWERNVKIYFKPLHISRQEYRDVERLGSMLGYLDIQMQINMLDYYLEQLKTSLQQAEEAYKGRCKLYRYMGMLGGAALAILVV